MAAARSVSTCALCVHNPSICSPRTAPARPQGQALRVRGAKPRSGGEPHGTTQLVFRKEAACPLRPASSRRVHAHSSGQDEALPGETARALGLVS